MTEDKNPSNQTAAMSEATLQDRKATGGRNALDGFDFQRRYALVKLAESLQISSFTAILIEGAEDVEVRFDNQGEVERHAIQVKNHLVKTSEAKEIITNFVKLDTDSPNTWKTFAIACYQLDEPLKPIHVGLVDYQKLASGEFYSEENKIYINTRDALVNRIREAGFQHAEFMLQRVSFETDLVTYKEDKWVRARVLELLQKALGINYTIAYTIYLELCSLISESTRKSIARRDVEEIFRQYKDRELNFKAQHAIAQAPEVKENYVPRLRETRQVVELLTADGTGAALRKVAIYGLPGSGKSDLTVAVADEDAIRQRFPGGVLWTTLGQEPNLVGILSGWVQALGKHQFQSSEPESLQTELNRLLKDSAVLIIIDDAWEAEQARLAVVGGPCCAVLLTTREVGIAKAAGVPIANLYEMPVMEEDQALKMLIGHPNGSLEVQDQDDIVEVARALGYLPLGLKLAAAQTRGEDPLSWKQLLGDLNQEIALLESLDDASLRDLSQADVRKHFSLVSSINLSFRRLSRPDLDKYAWFGVLPDDADIHAGMAKTLWKVDERQARNDLKYFREKALLSIGDQKKDGVIYYRLHDTLHDMAKRLLVGSPDPVDKYNLPGLGLNLADAHDELLERYRQQLTDGKWYTIPDDGYILQHLAWHMEKAGWYTELQGLFSDDAWMKLRFTRSGFTYTGFLTDLELAWRVSSNNDHKTLARLGTARQLVRLQARTFFDEDLQTLVWFGRMEEALGYARLRPSITERFSGLFAIYQAALELRGVPDSNLLDELINGLEAKTLEVSGQRHYLEYLEEKARNLTSLISGLLQLKRSGLAEIISSQVTEVAHQLIFADCIARALAKLGLAWYKAGQIEAANNIWLDAEETILPMNADKVEAEIWLAETYTQAGLVERARNRLSRALRATHATSKITGSRWALLGKLAIAYASLGDSQRAQRLIDVVEVVVNDQLDQHEFWTNASEESIYENLVEALAATGQLRRAYDTLLKIAPNSLEAKVYLALAASKGTSEELLISILETAWYAVHGAHPDYLSRWKEPFNLVLKAYAQAGRLVDIEDKVLSEDFTGSELELSIIANWLARSGLTQSAGKVLDIFQARQNHISLNRGDVKTLSAIGQALATIGQLNLAEQIIQSLPYPEARMELLLAIAKVWGQSGQAEKTASTFRSAIMELREIHWEKEDYELSLLSALAETDSFELMEEYLPILTTASENEFIAQEWMDALIAAGRLEQAEELALKLCAKDDIDSKWKKLLTRFQSAMLSTGRDENLRQFLKNLPNPILQGWLLAILVRHYVCLGKMELAQEIKTMLEEKVKSAADVGWSLAFHQIDLGLALDSLGNPLEADIYYAQSSQIAQRSGSLRLELSETLLDAKLETRRMKEALDWSEVMFRNAQGEHDDYRRDEQIARISLAFARYGVFNEALDFGARIKRSDWRQTVYTRLIDIFIECDDLDLVDQIAHRIPKSYASTGFYRAVLRATEGLLNSDRFEQALSLANRLDDSAYGTQHQILLAIWKARKGSIKEAFMHMEATSFLDYLLFLAKATPIFEQVRAGMGLTVLQEATGVAGWLIPVWKMIGSTYLHDPH